MIKIKAKFCGLTTHSDLVAAIESGADAVGFVFVPKSPRFISAEAASPLFKTASSAGVRTVALFANQEIEFIRTVIGATAPDVLQFHGDESADFCLQFGITYWKAVPMLAVDDYRDFIDSHPQAEAYLLDAYGQQQSGGSGKAFNWFRFPKDIVDSLILAGGLHAENIKAALHATGAKYIDTSSGIESIPGVKSRRKMMALMQGIHEFESTTKRL